MKIELFPTSFLAVSQIGELVSNLDLLHGRFLKAIGRLQNDAEARRVEIANRWKSMDVDEADRRRYVDQENAKALAAIRLGAEKELLSIFKEAGGLHARILEQRPFYATKSGVLNRHGLGTDRRALIEGTAAKARPVSLAGMMQLAIGTNDLTMFAALALENDARRESERGFDTREALELIRLDEYDKAKEYLALADVRFQAIVSAHRTWLSGKANPISTVSLALRKRELEVDNA